MPVHSFPTQYPLDALLQINMNTPIDPATIKQALSSPPFVNLPGAINIRDLGLLPSSPIPAGLVFRSGALTNISPPDLKQLGISMILDLRSEREVHRNPNPEVEGAENVWVEGSKAPSPIEMEKFVEADGVTAYWEMYVEVLEIYGPAFKKGLEWLRDSRGQGGLIVHCTAGKDRTGVFAALVLSLAGASRSLIAYDYALTRLGVEPSRELLLQMLKLWNKDWTSETPGMAEFVQVKGEFILALLDIVDRKYGGVEAYVRDVLGFDAEDVADIKGVLKGESKLVVSEASI